MLQPTAGQLHILIVDDLLDNIGGAPHGEVFAERPRGLVCVYFPASGPYAQPTA